MSRGPRTALGAALALAAACVAACAASAGPAARPAAPAAEDPFTAAVEGLERRPGLVDLYLDRERGAVLLGLPAPGPDGVVGEYLYVEGLVTGLGSNPIGLDRGQLGETRVVTLRRQGARLLVEQQNLRFRAMTERPAERRATRQSFATSVLWAGEIAATGGDGRLLVDFTSFAVRDAHRVGARIAAVGEGRFALDRERSALDLEACLAFPQNVELEALLTFAGESAGPHLSATAPDQDAFSLVQHHSLLALPDDGYRPRRFDPRAGSFAVEFLDYAAPLAGALETRWIARHRLAPGATIVYHVDPAIPEPVLGAVLDGARWWAEAFAAAGFPEGFRVELLPEDAHPLDARYHVIQWVHRSTRGWSYGGGVIDPRTGEIVKGHVSLGSLRVRQDRLIFEGLVGADKSGTGAADDPVELALARIRQLSAHEVGHTLGLAHNFAASTYGRASVMDYPAPLVGLGPGGELDLGDAYAVGVGAWDVHAVRYAYEIHPPEREEEALERRVREGLARGLVMLSDADARPPGAANSLASLWDNGADPVAQLESDLAVRAAALARFGEANVAPGRPLALLEEVLATLYFRHRYQLEAAVKRVGGLDYRYALRGDGQPGAAPVAGDAQRRALAAVLSTLAPEALDLPEGVLAVLLPRPLEHHPNRELFRGRSAPAFDPLAAAETAADLALAGLLQRERAARLVDFHRRDPALPGLEEVLAALVEAAFGPAPAAARAGTAAAPPDPRRAELARAVQRVAVARMIGLAADPEAGAAVASRVEWTLAALAERLAGAAGESPAERAHRAHLGREIGRHLARPAAPAGAPRPAPEPPPGPPIGSPPDRLADPLGDAGCAFAPFALSESGGRR